MAIKTDDDIVINILAKLDEKYLRNSITALNSYISKSEKEITNEINKSLNDATNIKINAIKAEIKAEEEKQRRIFAQLKSDIIERSKTNDLIAKQNADMNKRIAIDNEKARKDELARLKADMLARSNATYTKTTDTAGRKVYGDFSDISSKKEYTADQGTVWKNMRADAERAGAEAGRAHSKSFWGAIQEGTTFGHKLATTAQYMAAGAALGTVAMSVGNMVSAVIEADKYLGMFQAVLFNDTKSQGEAAAKARELQIEVFKVGEAYGGTTKELNESALALGRAGIIGKDLAASIKSVSQVALLSGDSLENITQLLVSWKTVYPDAKMNELADSMVGVANASLLSMDDLKTATTYMLTAGQQAGVTSDSLIALAGSWRQLGKAPSTVGTESRRFFEQITSGADDVKKAYKALGINVDRVKAELAKGGPEADAALKEFFRVVGSATQSSGSKAIKDLANILDKQTIQAAIAMGKVGKDGISLFDKMLNEAGDKANGAAEKGAATVALTYQKMWERIGVVFSEGAARLNDGFRVGFAGADATVEEFNIKLAGFSESFNKTMENLGKSIGMMLPIIVNLAEAFALFKAGSWLMLGLSKTSGLLDDFKGATFSAAGAVRILTAAIKSNPLFWGVAIYEGVVAGIEALTDFDEQVKKNSENMVEYKKKQEEYFKTDGQYAIDATYAQAKPLYEKLNSYQDAFNKSKTDAQKKAYATAIANTKKELSVYEEALVKQGAVMNKIELQRTVKKPDVTSGDPELKGKRGGADREALRAYNAAIAEIKVAEEKYFVENNITSQLEQQRYHVNNTVKSMERELGLIKDANQRRIEEGKINLDKQKTLNDMQSTEKAFILDNLKKQDALKYELALSQDISDEKKISLQTEQRRVLAAEELNKSLETIGTDAGANAKQIARNEQLRNIAKATYVQQLGVANALETKQLRLNKLKEDAFKYQQDTQSLELDATSTMSSEEQIRIEKLIIQRNLEAEILKIKQDYIAKGKENSEEMNKDIALATRRAVIADKQVKGAETYSFLMLKATRENARNASAAQSFVNVTEAGLSALDSGLQDFFDTGSEGFGKWSSLRDNLAKQIMKQLMQELVINQIIQSIRIGMGLAFSVANPQAIAATDAADMGFGAATTFGVASAQGNVFNDGHVNKYAKGGTFTNSLVSSPTYFKSGGTLGLMGEAGPEAILPLKRTSSGDLGVVSSGGSSGVQAVTVNIKNESGETLSVTKSEANTNMGEMVLDIWIDAVNRNRRGVRDMIRR